MAFCEIEEFPRKVLNKHWPNIPIYEDVRLLNGEEIEAKHGRIDVITGGFPCQDLSIAGKRKGLDGERSGLWSEIIRLAGDLRPGHIILENVANLLRGPSEWPGGWFSKVLGDLAELGYNAQWENIPAASMGAPHLRERVWIVAYTQQVERFSPLLSADNGTTGTRGEPAIGSKDRIRPEMGQTCVAISGGWMEQPDPKRMVDGFSDWSYRLAACGNSILPQIPEMIGYAILEAERLSHE